MFTEFTVDYRVVAYKFYLNTSIFTHCWGGVFSRPKFSASYGLEYCCRQQEGDAYESDSLPELVDDDDDDDDEDLLIRLFFFFL